jgi:parallel beta-helix repeat protein
VPAQAATQISSCPCVISAPGVYAVTQDLTCSGTAITILASNVDLHLGGHILTGDGSGAGVDVQGAANVNIHHGAVQGFSDGISLSGALGCKVSSVVASSNSHAGLRLDGGGGHTVINNTVTQTGDRGISVFGSNGNTVTRNTADRGGTGISVSDSAFGNTIARNSCTGNGTGIHIWVGPTQNTIEANTCNRNFGIGIHLEASAIRNTIQNNTANLNVLGIWLWQGCIGNGVQGNTALTNRDYDLDDENPNCDANVWANNRFSTDLVAGASDGGPGTGCIR